MKNKLEKIINDFNQEMKSTMKTNYFAYTLIERRGKVEVDVISFDVTDEMTLDAYRSKGWIVIKRER